jgi:hypothetical protein
MQHDRIPLNLGDKACRVRFGVALIVILSIWSTVRPMEPMFSTSDLFPQEDSVFKYETRFDQVKKYLPADQIIGYSDDFLSRTQNAADAWVLARYALAPSVLQRGYVPKTKQISAHWSGLLLENLHDPKADPYLLSLFPSKYFESQSNAPAPNWLFPTNRLSLIRDFGHGVRLYKLEDR